MYLALALTLGTGEQFPPDADARQANAVQPEQAHSTTRRVQRENGGEFGFCGMGYAMRNMYPGRVRVNCMLNSGLS